MCGDSLGELESGVPRAGEQSTTAKRAWRRPDLQKKQGAIVEEGKRKREGLP